MMSNTPKIGDRIRLIFMPNDPDPVPAGSLGTIIAVHPHHRWTQVEVDWDNGRSLMLTIPGDLIEILGPEGLQS
jgi:hypothetical protein